MKNINEYKPDYTTTPGEVLKDYMKSYKISCGDLALRLGLSEEIIDDILEGEAPITFDIAHGLESVFGRPAHFWENLESDYEDDCVRLGEEDISFGLMSRFKGWLDRLFDIN